MAAELMRVCRRPQISVRREGLSYAANARLTPHNSHFRIIAERSLLSSLAKRTRFTFR
jgi:hypothetical protein